LALKLCLQLVLDLLHYCERPLLQLINGEEVSNETAPKRDRKAPTWQGAQRSVAPALPWHRMAFLEVRIVQVLKGVAYLRQHFVGLRWLLATLLRETLAPLL
jgi:hypothetical protein